MKRLSIKNAALFLVGAALLFTGCAKQEKDSEKGNNSQTSEYVTRAEFEAYKKATAETLQLMQEAIDGKLDRASFQNAIKQIEDALADVSLRVRNLEDQ